jgi:hypothetical protein
MPEKFSLRSFFLLKASKLSRINGNIKKVTTVYSLDSTDLEHITENLESSGSNLIQDQIFELKLVEHKNNRKRNKLTQKVINKLKL